MTPWVSWRLKGSCPEGSSLLRQQLPSHWVSLPSPSRSPLLPSCPVPSVARIAWGFCRQGCGHSGPWLAMENPKRDKEAQGPQSACVPQPAVTGPVGLPSLRDSLLLGQGGLKRFEPQALWGQKWLVSSLWMSLYTLTPRLAPKRHSVSTLYACTGDASLNCIPRRKTTVETCLVN